MPEPPRIVAAEPADRPQAPLVAAGPCERLAVAHQRHSVFFFTLARLLELDLYLAPLPRRPEVRAAFAAFVQAGPVQCAAHGTLPQPRVALLAPAAGFAVEARLARRVWQTVTGHVAYEVQQHGALLTWRRAQNTPDLLQPERQGCGRAKQDDGAQVRTVNTFTEERDVGEHLQVATRQRGDRVLAFVNRSIAIDMRGRDSARVECRGNLLLWSMSMQNAIVAEPSQRATYSSTALSTTMLSIAARRSSIA